MPTTGTVKSEALLLVLFLLITGDLLSFRYALHPSEACIIPVDLAVPRDHPPLSGPGDNFRFLLILKNLGLNIQFFQKLFEKFESLAYFDYLGSSQLASLLAG
jgi:hypothetical protein